MKYVPGYLGNKREYISTTGDTMKEVDKDIIIILGIVMIAILYII